MTTFILFWSVAIATVAALLLIRRKERKEAEEARRRMALRAPRRYPDLRSLDELVNELREQGLL